jgi:hypothetical protein
MLHTSEDGEIVEKRQNVVFTESCDLRRVISGMLAKKNQFRPLPFLPSPLLSMHRTIKE